MASGCSGSSKSSCEEKITCRWDKENKECKKRILPFLLLGSAAAAVLYMVTRKETPYLCIRGKCTPSSYGVPKGRCTPWCYCDDPTADNYLKREECKYSHYECRSGVCVKVPGKGQTFADCFSNCVAPPPGPVQICLDPAAANYGKTEPCKYAAPIIPPVTICPHCKDPKATNFNGGAFCHNPTMCVYSKVVCSDPAASNYDIDYPCKYGCTPGKIETIVPCPLSGGQMWAVKSWRECKKDGSKFEVKTAQNGCFWELDDEISNIYHCQNSNKSWLEFQWRLIASVPYMGAISIEALDVNKKSLYTRNLPVSINPLQRYGFITPQFNGKVDSVRINVKPYILTTNQLLPNYPKKIDRTC